MATIKTYLARWIVGIDFSELNSILPAGIQQLLLEAVEPSIGNLNTGFSSCL
jgi:hypothetical protein